MELFSISLGLLFWTLLAIPIFLLWIFALVSVLRNDFEGNDKIVWLVLIIFLPFIGSILYFAIGRSKRVKIR
jgi:O-antigen ligase